MGQKVSPVGLRLGINKTWESKWYADKKDFAKYLDNDVKIRRFLEKKLKDTEPEPPDRLVPVPRSDRRRQDRAVQGFGGGAL